MFKNTIKLLSLTMAITMLLTACSTASSTAPSASPAPAASSSSSAPAAEPVKTEKVKIRFENFNAAGDNEKYMKQMIEEFNKVYPDIEIELQTIPFKGYIDQLMAKISSGQAPDVYELGFADLVSFAGKDVLLPLDDVIKSNSIDMSKYNKKVLDSFVFEGKTYGFPNSFSNVVMFYNKDLFDKAGVAYPTDDWNWNDALEAAKKIRALDKNTFGYYRPISYNEFFKVVAQNGGSIMNADGTKFTVNTPEAIEAAQYMVDIVNKHNVQPSDEQLAGMGPWDLFKSGRLGILMTGIWGIPDFVNDCEFAWDVAVEPGNKADATHFFCNAFVVSKDSKVAKEAALFMDFLCSAEQAVNIRIDANWTLPAVSNDSIIARYTSVTPPNNKKAVFDSLDYLVTPPVIEQSTEMQDIINKYLEQIVTNKATAKDALDACQKELEEKIKL